MILVTPLQINMEPPKPRRVVEEKIVFHRSILRFHVSSWEGKLYSNGFCYGRCSGESRLAIGIRNHHARSQRHPGIPLEDGVPLRKYLCSICFGVCMSSLYIPISYSHSGPHDGSVVVMFLVYRLLQALAKYPDVPGCPSGRQAAGLGRLRGGPVGAGPKWSGGRSRGESETAGTSQGRQTGQSTRAEESSKKDVMKVGHLIAHQSLHPDLERPQGSRLSAPHFTYLNSLKMENIN